MTSNYTYITAAGTKVIGPAAGVGTGRRTNCTGISINKTLAGTMTIMSGGTQIGQYAVGQTPGLVWHLDGGVEVPDLQIITTMAEDITVFWNNF